MIVPTVTFDTSKHCACETPRPATFTDRCLTCGGTLDGRAVPEAKARLEGDMAKFQRKPDDECTSEDLNWPCSCGHGMYVHDDGVDSCAACETCTAFDPIELPEAKAGDALAWSLDALAFIMGQTFKRPTVEFERTELVRRAKELGLLGEERPR